MIKRWQLWIPPTIGTVSVIALLLLRGNIEDIKTRVIVNLTLIVLALGAFLITLIPDKEQYTFRDITHNGTFMGAVILIIAMIFGLYVMVSNLGI